MPELDGTVNADALARQVRAKTKQADCWEKHHARSIFRNDNGESVCIECLAAALDAGPR